MYALTLVFCIGIQYSDSTTGGKKEEREIHVVRRGFGYLFIRAVHFVVVAIAVCWILLLFPSQRLGVVVVVVVVVLGILTQANFRPLAHPSCKTTSTTHLFDSQIGSVRVAANSKRSRKPE